MKHKWPLLVLTAIYAVVLFYDYTSIPFYHDELSAIERCKFGSLGELVTKGIMVDGHPAGVHLFLYGLIHLFGIHEWIIKLPFVLAGLGSLYFLYRIGEVIFSRYAATAAGVIFILSSYYISQIIVARPYSPGLFFSLGTFYYAFRLKYHPYNKIQYVLLALCSVGAMYSHYFSFLQAMLIWITVFVFNRNRIYLRYYFITFGISILCFLPHIGITMAQLEIGGLGWLGPPQLSFFPEFFYNYFNSSLMLCSIAAALFILSFFVKKPRKKNKATLLLLFALPCIIIYFYSVAFAPVLQAPALYFCTPYLLIFIGNGVSVFKNKLLKTLLVLAVLAGSAYSFLVEKQYYKLRDYQPIEKFVLSCRDIAEKNPKAKLLFVWKGNNRYIDFYLTKHQFRHRIITTDTLQNMKLINLKQYDEVVCNQLTPADLRVVATEFPYVISVKNNLLFTCMELGREDNRKPFYSKPEKIIFTFDTAKDWSQKVYTYKVKDLVPDLYQYVEFEPQLDSVVKGAELILETYSHNQRTDWRSVYLEPGNILSIKLKDVVHELSPDLTFKLYIWCNVRKASKPIEVLMHYHEDNPYEYEFRPE